MNLQYFRKAKKSLSSKINLYTSSCTTKKHWLIKVILPYGNSKLVFLSLPLEMKLFPVTIAFPWQIQSPNCASSTHIKRKNEWIITITAMNGFRSIKIFRWLAAAPGRNSSARHKRWRCQSENEFRRTDYFVWKNIHDAYNRNRSIGPVHSLLKIAVHYSERPKIFGRHTDARTACSSSN